MDRNAQKEEFSYAYIRAVASVAGYSVEQKSRPMDNAGVDLTIEVPGEEGSILFPRFDAQVKCTSSQKVYSANYIKFPLPAKNYNRLRSEGTLAPLILIVVLVPDNLNDWIKISENKTLIKHCGYWISLKGKPPTSNTFTVTIEIPRQNTFTPESLRRIMQKIGQREEL
ncbi:MAG: DUF4365 domain-containing protein [Cyanobacteriota bacterium]|nr:DUF4365 domain-containing protein [Cyanobacteriota bacterium]